MHDIDRTQLEYEQAEQEWGHEALEFEDEVGAEFEDEALGEFEDEMGGEFEDEGEDFLGGLLGGLLGGELETSELEMHEIEIASELLELGSEYELEQFLGDLVQRAAGAVGGFVRSPTGQQLTGILRQAAKQALPVVGGAIGDVVSPGAGGQWGRKIATAAGDLMGLELEGLSAQEQELEVARRVVRLASAAGQHAARAPRSAPPRAVAQRAAVAAARRHAPGLLRPGRTGWLRAAPARRAFARPGIRPAYAHGGPRRVGYRTRPTAGYAYGYAGTGSPFRRRRARPRPYHLYRRGYGYGYGPPRRYGYGYWPRYSTGYAPSWDGTDGAYAQPVDGYGAAPATQPAGTWARRGRNIVIYGVY